MTDAPEQISVAIHNGNLVISADGDPLSGHENHGYILLTEVAALIAEARREGWNAAIEASEDTIETMLRGINKMLAEIWGGSRRTDRLRSKRDQLVYALDAIRAMKEETQ